MVCTFQKFSSPMFRRQCFVVLLALCALFVPLAASAEPVNERDVRTMAQNWLSENNRPLGVEMGAAIREIVRYQGEYAGDIGYYLVMFEPNGWLIVPGDNRLWPTMTFGAGKMDKDAFERSPWYDMTIFETPKEEISFRKAASADADSIQGAQDRWDQLLQPVNPFSTRKGTEAPQDVWVAPLVKAAWAQTIGSAFAKKTTLKELLDGVPNNAWLRLQLVLKGYWTTKQVDQAEMLPGCNAVAVGQVMHYLMTEQYPGYKFTVSPSQNPISLSKRTSFIFNFNRPAPLYQPNWGMMPIALDNSARYGAGANELTYRTMLEQSLPVDKQAAAAGMSEIEISKALSEETILHTAELLRDVGTIMRSAYGEKETSAYLGRYGKLAFHTYGFLNAATTCISPENYAQFWRSLPKEAIDLILRTNLDYKHPVVASTLVRQAGWPTGGIQFFETINGFMPPYNHTFVIDGYGFDGQAETEAYYHVNMGRGGEFDGWSKNMTENIFAVDDKDKYPVTSPSRPYAMVFNIFATAKETNAGSIMNGEIISGRVAEDLDAYPIKPMRVTVRASWNDGSEYVTADTDENGIYALVVPPKTTVTLQVVKGGNPDPAFPELERATGQSEYASHRNGASDADILARIGNVWGADFQPTLQPIMVVREREETDDAIPSVLTAMGYGHTTLSIDDITSGMDWESTKVLFVEGNRYFNNYSFAGDGKYTASQVTDAIIAIVQFARNGGQVFVTGKADYLMRLLGMQNGVSPYEPTRYGEQVYGSSTVNSAAVVDASMRSSLGQSSINLKYTSPMAAHSMINISAATNSAPELRSPYLLRWVVVGGQADWREELKEFLTSLHFQSRDGRVQYANYPLAANYADNGAVGKALVEYQVNGALLRAGLTSEDALMESRGIVEAVSARGGITRGSDGGYRYSPGYGNIVAKGAALHGASLRMDGFVSPDDLEVWRVGDDLILHVRGVSGHARMTGWYDGGNTLGSVSFEDGIVMTAADLEAAAVEREPDIDAAPVSSENTITAQNGVASGTEKNDILFGGKGDDLLSGGGGSNIYYYRLNEGHDAIVNAKEAGSRNVLRFHTDIASSDIRVSRSGEDLRLDVPDGSVTVRGWFANDTAKLDLVQTYDGAFWDARDLEKLAEGGTPSPRRIAFDIAEFDVGEAAGDNNADPQASGSSGGGCGAAGGAWVLFALLPPLFAPKGIRR